MKLTVNGKSIEARPGTTVLEAAKAAGIYIPSLCYYPAIEPVGSCRLCAVEVDGMRGLPGACTLQAQDGLVVHTETARVGEFRRTILENLLRDHPRDCTLCAGNLQCELQKIATYIGLKQVGPPPTMRVPQDAKDEVFFVRDYNRCIRCGRCIRVCRELRGYTGLNFLLDEKGLAVGTPLNRSLMAADCRFCGACIDACPTGALVDKEYEGLPAKEVMTICPYCGVGCQIKLQVRQGRVVQVTPDYDSPVNNGQACVRGRFGVAEVVHHAQRLAHPLIRQNGELKQVTWEEALDFASVNLARFSGPQIAVVASTKTTNEDTYLAQKFARAVLHTNNIDSAARLSQGGTAAALSRSFGDGLTNSVSEIRNAACLLVMGSNATSTHPVVAIEIANAARKGSKLIVVNPESVELTKQADIWLRNRPGTDTVLLMGLMRVIVDEGLQDDKFISQYCEDFGELLSSLPDFDLDAVETVTGVSQELITRTARILATLKPAAIIYATGLTQHRHGTQSVLAIANLAMLTGNIGKPGAGIFPLAGQNNAQGASDMGALPNCLPGYQPIADAALRRRFETAWDCRLNAQPGAPLTDLPARIKQGKIKSVYSIGANPDLSGVAGREPGSLRQGLEFLIVQDLFLTPLGKCADVVFPACSFAEKDGTFTNSERRVQRIRKTVDEVGLSRPDWWIICELARKMGAPGFDYQSPAQILAEAARLTPAYDQMSFDSVDAAGGLYVHSNGDQSNRTAQHEKYFARRKGRFAPLYYGQIEEPRDEEYPLILTTVCAREHFGTGQWTARVKGFASQDKTMAITVHPEDAKKYSIAEGDLITVVSRHGELVANAKLSEDFPSGVLAILRKFKGDCQAIFGVLPRDPVSKTPEYKYCAVRLDKVRGQGDV